MAITIGTRPPLIDGCWASWDEKQEPTIVRTQMEDGTTKVRRRTTGRIRYANVTVTLKASQYDALQQWFNVDCAQGIFPTRVMTPYGKEEVWRFTEAPDIKWLDPKAFSVTAKLEQLSGWDAL